MSLKEMERLAAERARYAKSRGPQHLSVEDLELFPFFRICRQNCTVPSNFWYYPATLPHLVKHRLYVELWQINPDDCKQPWFGKRLWALDGIGILPAVEMRGRHVFVGAEPLHGDETAHLLPSFPG